MPVGQELKELYSESEMAHSLSCLRTESIRPQMSTTEIQDRVQSIKQLSTPYFPLEIVKAFAIDALGRAVQLNQVHNRDPIGGSNENLFVPLLKMIDKLLLVGVLEDDDVPKLLILIDPETWDPTFDRQVPTSTQLPLTSLRSHLKLLILIHSFHIQGKDEHRKGLLQMNLAEGVKLEICWLLHHLWDGQLRHRVEAIVSFSTDYLGDIQNDQLRRYIELKQSDLPTAIAAKKSREFRCPPREQMNAILGFKNLEDEEKDNCYIPDELTGPLVDFHQDFISKLLNQTVDEELLSEENVKEENKPGLVNRMMNVITLVKKAEEEVVSEERVKTPEEIFRQVLISTIVRWAQETVN